MRKTPFVLLPTASRKWWIYQIWSFIVSRDTLLIGNRTPNPVFYWNVNCEFYSSLEIGNCKSV